MPTPPKPVALVTGASTGIGRATALALARAGVTVYAAARSADRLAELESDGCHALPLDVTDDAALTAGVGRLLAEQGRIDVLINNAGWGHLAPCEEIDLATWRRQFETNVFGVARLCQLVLPTMRAQRSGRIINVSSESGEMTFPLCAAYSGTKRALEALNDALRFEVRAFGIRVISIQPGAVKTPLGDSSAQSLRVAPDSPYASFVNAMGETMRTMYERGTGVLTPEAVARRIVHAATAASPQTRYRIGPSARGFVFMSKVLSDRQWDAMIARLLLSSEARRARA